MASRAEVKRHAGSVNPEDFPDFGTLVQKGATQFVKNYPKTVSFWAVGLMIVCLGTGFAVDELTAMEYRSALERADGLTQSDMRKALSKLKNEEDAYYAHKGWFSCDDLCQKYASRVEMAKSQVQMLEDKKQTIIREARSSVGIWSHFGVSDVRKSFWDSWESGKAFAKRCTMYDALFMAFSSRDDGAAAFILRLVFQFVANLTLGLIGGFIYFIFAVIGIIQSYGPDMVSGFVFFALVVVAATSMLATYLVGVYGTLGGALYYGGKKMVEQARLEQERGGRRPRPQMQYRSHYD